MKHFLPSMLVFCGLSLPSYGTPFFNATDSWSRTEITPPQRAMPLNEMLAAYQKSAHANLFADVTGLSASQPINSPLDFVAPKNQMARGFALARLGMNAQMTDDRATPDTYVMWPRPDLDQIALLLRAAQEKFDADNPSADRTTSFAALRDFYIREKGWNPQASSVDEKNRRAQGVAGSIKFDDLPPSLRSAIRAELARQIRFLDQSYPTTAWDDDYWQDAYIRLGVPSRKDRSGTKYPTIEVDKPPQPGKLYPQQFVLGVPMQVKVARILPANKPHPSVCQNEQVAAETPESPQLPPGFDFSPLQKDDLQKVVVLNQRFVPLATVIADLNKQTGVALSLSPDVAPNVQTVALSGGMPLWSAMAAIARLYSAHWEKSAMGYRLVTNHLDALHTLMARMGKSVYYRFAPLSPDEQLQQGSDLATQIVDDCDQAQLRSEQGVALSTLPAELRKSIIDLIREQNVGGLIVAQQRLDDTLSQNLELRFAPRPASLPQFFGAGFTGGTSSNGLAGDAILSIYTSDGRFVVSPFPEFVVPKASKLDIEMENMQKEQDRVQAQLNAEGKGAPQQ